jgi:hypothetical protein
MNFRRTNNITGWLVFLIAFATYFLTREARGSLWDCGEFVSSADKVQLPHPPGAPMFVLLGRFFIILFGDNKMTAANAVNVMSALASAATILFLFWSITHFARKMFVSVGEQLNSGQIISVMGAGAVGALVYTFSDSFWFSAVEGEVYALSSFFTALVFWAILKWEHADERAGIDPLARARSDRWIVFLFFMIGLSIGVHLLNILTIPAIVMVYFFRRNYRHEESKADFARIKKDNLFIWTIAGTVALCILLIVAGRNNRDSDPAKFAYVLGFAGALVALGRLYFRYPELRKVATAFIVGCLITGLTQLVIIQYSMKGAGLFDVFFKNSLHMPFFTGFAVYFLAVAALIAIALRFDENKINRTRLIIWFIAFLFLSVLPFVVGIGSAGAVFLKFLLIAGVGFLCGYFIKANSLRAVKLGLWCYAFMMLGYCMYFTAIIRSNANPTIDMNNVDNPINLVYYLSREQYGEAPLVYGPHFAAEYDRDDDGNVKLTNGEMKYVKGSDRYIPIGRQRKPQYKSSDMQIFPRVWDGSHDQYHDEFYASWLGLGQDPQTGKYQAPSYGDNVNWFFSYQMGLMYWRYFMWNFSGKQNDVQGLGNKRDGNWITGISMIDNARLGDQDKLPDSIKHNQAHNKLYLLPFLLGMLGCVYQFFRNRKDWVVTFLLFFMTGLAVVIYLNQPGNQPRERDYAYVGSFYAFAMWIGLAVIAFIRLAREQVKSYSFQYILVRGSILTFLITFMSCANDVSPKAMIITTLAVTALFSLFTAAITYLVRAVSSGGIKQGIANAVTITACLVAPLIMAQQEWDDHDRLQKTTAPDIARDYLESCAPNAVLFTFGDNDTYPLWYAQEVEGVRTDVRVINNSLLGIDWYINQLRYKVNNADSLDVIWTPEQIQGHNREYLQFQQQGNPNEFYDLYDVMKDVIGKTRLDADGNDVGDGIFPVAKFKVPVDIATVRSNGTVNASDSVSSEIRFEIPQAKLKDGLLRSDLIILNFIASNHWKRPIYFTSPYGELGFGQYLRKDGLSYRLVPVLSGAPQENWVAHQSLRRVGMGGTQIKDNNDSVIYPNLMNKYAFGAPANATVYFDEENRRHILSLRSLYAEAAGNLADEGRKDEAQHLLEKAETGINPKNLPYAMVSRFGSHNVTSLIYLEACYKAGKNDIAEKYRAALQKDFEQQRAYYLAMNDGNKPVFNQDGSVSDENAPLFKSLGTEYQINEALMAVLNDIETKYVPQKAKGAVETGGQTITNTIKPDTSRPDTGH